MDLMSSFIVQIYSHFKKKGYELKYNKMTCEKMEYQTIFYFINLLPKIEHN